MKRVILTRDPDPHPDGTFGSLTIDGTDFAAVTVERLPDGEHPCIPLGTYPLKPCTYYGGDGPGGKPDYPAYEVLDVPGRSQIKIHRANLASQLLGCIAPGEGFARFDAAKMRVVMAGEPGVRGVVSSRAAHDRFMAAMSGEDGTLEVVQE